MTLDQTIINKMREIARSGGDVIAIVSCLRASLECQRPGTLLVLRYFMEAFHLSLSEVRPLEGAKCLGNSAYDDREINSMLLPLIQ